MKEIYGLLGRVIGEDENLVQRVGLSTRCTVPQNAAMNNTKIVYFEYTPRGRNLVDRSEYSKLNKNEDTLTVLFFVQALPGSKYKLRDGSILGYNHVDTNYRHASGSTFNPVHRVVVDKTTCEEISNEHVAFTKNVS